MATLKTGNGHGKYFDPSSFHDVIAYILNPHKVPNFYGGYHINMIDPIEDMAQISTQYGKTNGVHLRHFILSFSPDEVQDASIVNKIARMIVPYLGREYQTVFAVHEDAPHLHIHIVCNAISYIDGHRYRGGIGDYNRLYYYIRSVLKAFRIYNFHDVPYVPASGHPDE